MFSHAKAAEDDIEEVELDNTSKIVNNEEILATIENVVTVDEEIDDEAIDETVCDIEIDETVDESIEDIDCEETSEEDNLCYYCNTMFDNQEELVFHMTQHHMDLFTTFQQQQENPTNY